MVAALLAQRLPFGPRALLLALLLAPLAASVALEGRSRLLLLRPALRDVRIEHRTALAALASVALLAALLLLGLVERDELARAAITVALLGLTRRDALLGLLIHLLLAGPLHDRLLLQLPSLLPPARQRERKEGMSVLASGDWHDGHVVDNEPVETGELIALDLELVLLFALRVGSLGLLLALRGLLLFLVLLFVVAVFLTELLLGRPL